MSETGEQQKAQRSSGAHFWPKGALRAPDGDPPSPPPPADPAPPSPPPPPADPKPPEHPKPDAPTPLTAEAIKLPEGITVDEALMGEFVGVMNNDKLAPAERAQALVDLQLKAMNAAREGDSKLWTDTQAQWQKEAREDPEIGGDKLDGTLSNVAKLIDKYAPGDAGRELREVFELTGAGNNPHIIRFLNKVAGELVVEGRLVPGAPGPSSADPAATLYPTMSQGKAS